MMDSIWGGGSREEKGACCSIVDSLLFDDVISIRRC